MISKTDLLKQCCGSQAWVNQMAHRLPFKNREALFESAIQIWHSLSERDWLEAFKHHPRIGEQALLEKYSKTAHLSSQEQKGVEGAESGVIQRLATLNDDYYNKFGFVFLICATGKSAAQMLQALEVRLSHTREQEIAIACLEHQKITELRLTRVLEQLIEQK